MARDFETLSRDPQFQLFRERRLRQDNAGAPPSQKENDNSAEVREMADNYTKVADKADQVLAEASRIAIIRRIPVPEREAEVRAAVRRQDEASGGLYIDFTLYRTAVNYARQGRAQLPASILDGLTGEPAADHKHIHTTLREVSDGIDRSQAELIGSQIVILFMLKLLQLGMDALSDGAQSATKQPSGSELAIITAQMGISIAATQAYTAITEELMEETFKELNTDFPAADVEKAKKQLADSPLFQAALAGRKPSDYELIVRFVDAFLHRQTDAGWENWQVAAPLLEASSWARESAKMLQPYARPAEEATDDQNVSEDILEVLRNSVSVTNNVIGQPREARMIPQLQRTYQAGLNKINKGVDAIAQILGHNPTIEDMCCFLRWAGRQPPEVSEQMINMLKFFQGTLERLDSLADVQTLSANLSISSAIHQTIMLLLNDLNRNLVARLKEWFQTDPEKWGELVECRLIDELLEYLLRTMEKLEGRFLRFIERYLSGLEEFEQSMTARLDVIGNQKEIRMLITIIEQVVNTAENLNDPCPDVTDPKQLAEAARRVQEGLGPTAAVPIDVGGDPYATVQSEPITLSTGVVLPATDNASAGVTPEEAAQEVCRAGRGDPNLVPFPRGPLNGEAQTS
jgi:hypothetical protein